MWLCSEADQIFKEFGIDYVITESHGILYADPTPIYGTFAPIVFSRRSCLPLVVIWNLLDKYGVLFNGYPGDFNYREYYRDIGYDLDYDYVKALHCI